MLGIESLEDRRLFTDVGAPSGQVFERRLAIVTGTQTERVSLVVADGVATLHVEFRGLLDDTLFTEDRVFKAAELGEFDTVWVSLQSGDDVATITSDIPGTVLGGEGHDRITFVGRATRVIGGSGNDTLRSIQPILEDEPESTTTRVVGRARYVVPAADVIGESRVTLEGGAGKDTFYTRGGDDEVRGGSGRDRLITLGRDVEVRSSLPTGPISFPEARIVIGSRVTAFGVERIEREDADGVPVLARLQPGTGGWYVRPAPTEREKSATWWGTGGFDR